MIRVVHVIFILTIAAWSQLASSVYADEPRPPDKTYFGIPDENGDVNRNIWWTRETSFYRHRNYFTPDDDHIFFAAEYGAFADEEGPFELIWYKPNGEKLTSVTDLSYPLSMYKVSRLPVTQLFQTNQFGKWKVELYARGKLLVTSHLFFNYLDQIETIPAEELQGVGNEENKKFALSVLRTHMKDRIQGNFTKEAFVEAAVSVLEDRGYVIRAIDDQTGVVQTEYAKKEMDPLRKSIGLLVGAKHYEVSLTLRYENTGGNSSIVIDPMFRFVRISEMSEEKMSKSNEYMEEMKAIAEDVRRKAENTG